jgi:1,4-dihydroxy-2-naphthoate octaprenyltransferase
MKVGVIILALLSFISGLQLLNVAFGFGSRLFYIFLGIGVLSIIAAYTYTAGKRPYGYAGFGDLMVLIFFGLVGVAGTYYLFNPEVESLIVLPALSLGLLATGVLNINNMRDLNSDRLAGKITIPVRLGLAKAKTYHAVLLLSAITLAAIYIYLSGVKVTSLIFILALPMVLLNLYKVKGAKAAEELDPYLKQLAISTFFFMLFFGLGIVL